MAVFVMNYTQSKGAAKANIKYMQHRPGGKTERNHLTHCCALAGISNPEQLWYFKTYHDLTCKTLSSDYHIGWSYPFKTRKKVPQKDKKERTTRTLFGWDGAMERQDAYRMVDEAEGGSSFFRIKISPDPKTEDTRRDLPLREVTETIMQTFEDRIHKQEQWVAAEHDDHTPKRHVHVLAVSRGRLNRGDLKDIIQQATDACLAQRRALDLAQEQMQEREGEAWERSR